MTLWFYLIGREARLARMTQLGFGELVPIAREAHVARWRDRGYIL